MPAFLLKLFTWETNCHIYNILDGITSTLPGPQKWHLLPVSNVTTSHPLHIGCCLVTGSCPTLCDPMDYSPSDSYIHGIFKARLLKWVAISSSRGSSRHRDQTHISCLRWATRKAVPAALHFLLTSRLWLLIAGDVGHLESLNLFEFLPSLLGFTVQR